MGIEDRYELGSIQIHKKVIAEIAYTAMLDIEGVSPLEMDAKGILLGLLGQTQFPGIAVLIDKNNEVSVTLKIKVRYGLDIPSTAKQVQSLVRNSIERAVDISLKDINVSVQGIERGQE